MKTMRPQGLMAAALCQRSAGFQPAVSPPCSRHTAGGSSVKTQCELRNGKPGLVRLPEINLTDDKAGKPVGINAHRGIGEASGQQTVISGRQR